MKIIKILGLIACISHAVMQPVSVQFQASPNSPITTGTSPDGVAFSPLVTGGLFVATANVTDGSISVFSVNQSTGYLTEIAGSPFFLAAGGLGPIGISYSPVASSNLFLATANASTNNVSVFSVTQADGSLAEVTGAGSPFPTGGTNARDIAISPVIAGNVFVAVPNFDSANVSIFMLNTTTGALTAVLGSPFLTGGVFPSAVAFSPVVAGGLFLAVANGGSFNISVFSVDATTGALTAVLGSPFFAPFMDPAAVAYSPITGGKLFASVTGGGGDNLVDTYSVDPTTGVFSLVQTGVATGNNPVGIAFSPLISGSLLVGVTNEADGTISLYLVDQITGHLSPLFTTSSLGTGPVAIAFSPVISDYAFTAVPNEFSSNLSVYKATIIPPPIPSSKIVPPTDLKASKIRNRFLTQSEIANVLAWRAPTNGASPVAYRIFRDAALTDLAGTVTGNGRRLLRFIDHNRQKNVVYTYYIVSVDSSGNVSQVATVTAE